MAASLWAVPGGAVSHRSAAWLYRFRVPWSPLIEVTLPKKRKAPAGIALHFDQVSIPVATVTGIRVPRPEVVLVQLCGVLHRGRATAVIDRAIYDGVVGIEALSRTLEKYGSTKRHGLATFREILGDRYGIGETDSWAEDFFARLARKHGLDLVHHHVVRERSFLAELDFANLVTKVNIEIDGSLVHNNPIQTESDKRRDVELSLRGWLVLRFTYRELTEHPDWVIASIRTAISARTLTLFS
jgi:very-short-patch-repair endonuclease